MLLPFRAAILLEPKAINPIPERLASCLVVWLSPLSCALLPFRISLHQNLGGKVLLCEATNRSAVLCRSCRQVMPVDQCRDQDRLGLGQAGSDHSEVVYILTLGTEMRYRRQVGKGRESQDACVFSVRKSKCTAPRGVT